MSTAVLVPGDFQIAYFKNPGLESRRKTLIKNRKELISEIKKTTYPIFIFVTEHAHDGSTWTLNMHDDGEGYLLAGNQDTEIIAGLDIEHTIRVTKTRDSAFFDTNFAMLLRTMSVSQIILCGVSTHTCVAQTSADAYAANFRVLLAKDAIASHKPQFDTYTLEILRTEYRQDVRMNSQILSLFGNHSEELLHG